MNVDLREAKVDCQARGSFTVSDLYEAAFLVATGHRVQGVEPEDDERMGFAFEDTPAAREAHLHFLSNEYVGVQAFVAAIHTLKRLLRKGGSHTRRNAT